MYVPVHALRLEYDYSDYDEDKETLVKYDKEKSTWHDIAVMARFPALFGMPRGAGRIAAQIELGAWRKLLEKEKDLLQGTKIVYSVEDD